MAENYEEIIVELKLKINKVIDSFEAAKKDNETQKNIVENLRQEISRRDLKIEELEKKLETYKIAKTVVATSDDAHDAKIKINRIVREIDKCISLMNK